jgi:hypothetical protein
LWQRVFPDIEHHGVDIQFTKIPQKLVERVTSINNKRATATQSFDIHIGDQSSSASLLTLMQLLRVDALRETSQFDVIIDDGSHASNMHIVSMNALFPFLRAGGIYVIEVLIDLFMSVCVDDP